MRHAYYGLFSNRAKKELKKAIISTSRSDFVKIKLSLEKDGFKLIKRTKLHGA